MLTYVSGLNRFFIFFLCFLLVMSFGVHYNAMVVKKSLPISILTLNPLCPPTFSGWGNGAEMTGRPPPLIFLTPLSIVDLTRPIWSGGSYYCVSSSRRYKRFSPHNGAHFRAFQFTPRSNATTKVSINRLGLSQSPKAFQITPCSKCFNTMHYNGSVTCCSSVPTALAVAKRSQQCVNTRPACFHFL